MRISDWSSDVCSSDLCHFPVIVLGADGDNEVNQGIRFPVRRSHRRQLAELAGTEINLGVDPQVNAVRQVSPVFDRRVASPFRGALYTRSLRGPWKCLKYSGVCIDHAAPDCEIGLWPPVEAGVEAPDRKSVV